MDLIDTRVHSYSSMRVTYSEQCCEHSIIKPACVPITILSLVVLTIVFYPLLNEEILGNTIQRFERTGECTDTCSVQIVETIPTNVSFGNYTENLSTYDAWKQLLDEAERSIDITVFYWNLRDSNNYSTSWQSVNVYLNHKIFHYLQTTVGREVNNLGKASVRSLDFVRLLGGGVLHTKMWIVDDKHIYVGSANMDWKSLTEVKELGYLIKNCSCMASDFSKIFTVYWRLGGEASKIPVKWPLNLRTYFNFTHPLKVFLNSKPAQTFISSSPDSFNTKSREHDVDAITAILKSAKIFAHIAVMDYLPTTVYFNGHNMYWPIIDDAIRTAVYNGVSVRLLISHWNHSRVEIVPYLKSLIAINDAFVHKKNFSGRVEAKLFTVPSDAEQAKLSFARVNHNKYMVTDQVAYVGTSNWVGDYFINTAGVGVSFIAPDVVQMLNDVFTRDWNSEYSSPV
ncbi:unnamed protein product [Enterobius vermicularis]|uniref:PLD phosphodiesterase domain-containing protein n=1 Tax=Enterobius vermicularis TaxID=51028 RepID=A0A158Q9B3_ENTVE|nr:unnamed protein product [Enterobius vermicularis]